MAQSNANDKNCVFQFSVGKLKFKPYIIELEQSYLVNFYWCLVL